MASEIYRHFIELSLGETPDRLRAEQECAGYGKLILDRLLVGDVGFGKTEIASVLLLRHQKQGSR